MQSSARRLDGTQSANRKRNKITKQESTRKRKYNSYASPPTQKLRFRSIRTQSTCPSTVRCKTRNSVMKLQICGRDTDTDDNNNNNNPQVLLEKEGKKTLAISLQETFKILMRRIERP